MKDHRRKSPRASWTIKNADGLEVLACNLKHLEGSVKGLQEVLSTGYAMAVRTAT